MALLADMQATVALVILNVITTLLNSKRETWQQSLLVQDNRLVEQVGNEDGTH